MAQVADLGGYETTFIVRNELTEDGVKALVEEKLGKVVESFKGEVVLTEDWGKRRLSYPIQKESRGRYVYFVYTGEGEVVKEVERNLKLHDDVLRFLTIRLGRGFDVPSFQKKRQEAHARQASRKKDEHHHHHHHHRRHL